jgi:DNA-directed RNA polymerase specialized sigma24 family protein
MRSRDALGTDCGGGSVPETFIALLLEIRHDPGIWRLACRWAGCPELARDGLQDAFILLATLRDRDHIVNVRAYFCTTLYNEIIRQRRQLAPVTRLDPQLLADMAQAKVLPQLPDDLLPVDELADWHLRCQQRLNSFSSSRGELEAMVPSSSGDPARYRRLIMAVAESVLREAFYGCMSRPELSATLRVGYPEWFDAADIPASVRHKRLSRARRDIGRILTTVIAAPRAP